MEYFYSINEHTWMAQAHPMKRQAMTTSTPGLSQPRRTRHGQLTHLSSNCNFIATVTVHITTSFVTTYFVLNIPIGNSEKQRHYQVGLTFYFEGHRSE